MPQRTAILNAPPRPTGRSHSSLAPIRRECSEHPVLIADDDPITLKLVSKIVYDMGHPVVTCSDGSEALRHLTATDGPALAIVDWNMPGMSGLDIGKTVRNNRLDEHVYILMLTGRDSDSDVALALNAGVDDYVTKPINAAVLRARLRAGVRVINREDYLRQLLDSHTNLLRSLPSALIAINNSDTITAWNSVASEIFAITGPDAIGNSLLSLPLQWDWHMVLEALAQARDSHKQQNMEELVIHMHDASPRCFSFSVSPVLDSWQRVSGMLFLLSDVSDQKQLQRQLQQAQRLEAIGELAAGIAHELNTPSQFVSDNLEFLELKSKDLLSLTVEQQELLKRLPDCPADGTVSKVLALTAELDLPYLIEEIPAAIAASRRGMEQISRIVKATNQFAHPGRDLFEAVSINQIVRDTIEISRGRWKHHARVVCDLHPEIPDLECCRSEMNQVLLNLIVNAAQAIEMRSTEESGEITITTTVEEEHVILRVRDTGVGIPAEHMDKLYNPFFTTKEPGKGTGQGLALVHRIIVDRHGGQISILSTEGVGSEFSVSLPLRQQ